jgi:hypothetical protein
MVRSPLLCRCLTLSVRAIRQREDGSLRGQLVGVQSTESRAEMPGAGGRVGSTGAKKPAPSEPMGPAESLYNRFECGRYHVGESGGTVVPEGVYLGKFGSDFLPT